MFNSKKKHKEELKLLAIEIASQLTSEPTQKNATLQQEFNSIFNQLVGTNDKITDPFEQSLWVAACINTIVNRFASAPFEIKEGDKLTTDKKILSLFNHPNPFMDGNLFQETIAGLVSLTGNAMIVMDGLVDGKTSKLPSSMWPLHSKHLRPVLNKERNMPSFWELEVDGEKTKIHWENVLHIKTWNPNSMIIGHDPLKPAKNTIAMDFFSGLFNRKFFQNNATPSGVLSTEKNVSSDVRKEIRENWTSNHNGVENSNKIAVLSGGLKYTQMGLTQQDMQFIEGKKLSREEIAAILGVPPATVGIFEFANYANSEAQIKMLWEATLIPLGVKVASVFNSMFFARFSPTLSVSYNTSNIKALQEDEDKKVARAQVLFNMGVTLDVINTRLKLELDIDNLPWKNTWLVPFSLISAAELIKNPLSKEKEENSTDINNSVNKYVNVRLSRAKWVEINRKSRKNVKAFEKEMVSFFDKQEKLLLNELKNATGIQILSILVNGANDVVNFDWTTQDRLLIKRTKPHYLDSLELGGSSSMEEIKIIGIDFSTDDKLVTDFLLDKENFVTGINDTVREQLILQIAEGVEAGESIQQLTDRLSTVYDQARTRAQNIARTETNDAVNGGRTAGYGQAGVEGKTWLNSGKENVRESHSNGAGVGGETVKIDESFSNGLRWPSDTANGEPAETNNCVCTITAKVKIK